MVAIFPGRFYKLINFRSSTAIEVPNHDCAPVARTPTACTPAVCTHAACNTSICSPAVPTTTLTPATSTTTYSPANSTATCTPAAAATTYTPATATMTYTPATETTTTCTSSACTCTTTMGTCTDTPVVGSTTHVDKHHHLGHHHHESHCQEWVFEERHGGMAIFCKRMKKYLVVDGDLKHGARVVAVYTHSPQIWEIRRVENDCIRIFAMGTSYNIDMCDRWHGGHGACHTGGIPLIISHNCHCKNQLWRVHGCGNATTLGVHAKL